MRRLLFLCLLWCLPGLVFGQTLTIDVPAQSQPYTLIDATATPGMNGYLWILKLPNGTESTEIRRTGPNGDTICFTGPPGKLTLEVIATTANCVPLRAVAHPVIGEAPAPNPQPGPSPEKVAAVVVVIESSQQTPDQAAVILDTKWRDYLRGLKVPFRVVDPDVKDQAGDVPSDLAPALTAAKATPGHDCCFVFEGGNVICKPLPATPAAMLALFKMIGGE